MIMQKLVLGYRPVSSFDVIWWESNIVSSDTQLVIHSRGILIECKELYYTFVHYSALDHCFNFFRQSKLKVFIYIILCNYVFNEDYFDNVIFVKIYKNHPICTVTKNPLVRERLVHYLFWSWSSFVMLLLPNPSKLGFRIWINEPK